MITTRIDGIAVDRLPAEDIANRRWGSGLLWVEAESTDEEELEYLVKAFRIHPLAEEDIRKRNQRPKKDEYGDEMFIVVFGAVQSEGVGTELRELHLLVGPQSVLSITDKPLPHVARLGEHCEKRPALAAGPEGQLVYRLVDAAMDSFFPVVDRMEADIDALETRILEHPDATVVRDIFDLKRDLNLVRRILGPQRDLLQGLAGAHGATLGPEAQIYLRDVYDHAVRIVEEIDSARDLITGALDVYLSSVSNRLGEQTRRLSIVATIFLPLTFLTGFFGQNFGFLIDKISSTAAFAIGISIEFVSVAIIATTIRYLNARARPIPQDRHTRGSRAMLLRVRAGRRIVASPAPSEAPVQQHAEVVG